VRYTIFSPPAVVHHRLKERF